MLRLSFLGFLAFSSAVSFSLLGCGVSSSSSSSGGVASEDGFSDSGGAVAPPNGDPTQPSAGTLTAGEWDDNLNFSLFRAYVDDYLATAGEQPSTKAELPSADRVILQIETESGAPVSNALVSIASGAQTFLSAKTGSDGRLLFFPQHDGAMGAEALTVTITPPPDQPGVEPLIAPAPVEGSTWSFTLPGAAAAPPSALDLAFVIDATGSMGDEIQYLKAEVQGIASSIQGQFQGVSIHYALVMYRDEGDEYVTRTFNFTDNLAAFSFNLAQQSADGGGDTPEAMDQALAELPQLSWRAGNTARMAFLVADAPPHADRAEAYLAAVDALRPKAIKLYPVAASGVSTDAEYLMRVGAEATLGRYLFLTDDSGVGNPHEAPHIPCFQVQKLSKLMARMIASELTGTRVPAAPEDVIRSVGNPEEGVCTLEDGTQAYF
jgi:hypothetical protein